MADSYKPHGPKASIAIFSGPRATIQNSAVLRTSSRVRAAKGLPGTEDGGYDTVRSQMLAAPVKAYVAAYSAHPLEADAAELYGPVDGYVDPDSGGFSAEPRDGWTPVYEVLLDPADGPLLLPYAATQADGSPWDSPFSSDGALRQTFYPDASRIVAEIDRFGIDGMGHNNLLSSVAEFTFVRAAPSGGYTRGLPAERRTDVGEGDIAPEVLGEDFFPYFPLRQEPALSTLARLTNTVARTLTSTAFDGAVWLEGSPTTEETLYWLNLLINTTVPIVGNCSQYPHGVLGNDGDHNLVQSVTYISSRVWAGEDGTDRVGAVMVQNGQVFTAREVQKADARPGGYVAMGGHGGIVGNTVWQPVLSFVPTSRHTHTSEVRLTQLPATVTGVQQIGDTLRTKTVQVKDEEGYLLDSALPKVTIVRYANFSADDFNDSPDREVEILARIEANLHDYPLAGFVAEGSSPYGALNESMTAALHRAVRRGMPVVAVGRGGGGYVPERSNQGGLFVTGSNLTAPKARMLLMACLLRFGSLPIPANPSNPTAEELSLIRKHVSLFQEVFRTH